MRFCIQLFLALLITGFVLSCREPEPYVITCVDGVIPYKEAEYTTKRFDFKNDNPNDKERSKVIQSEIELNSYLDATSFSGSRKIDFRSQTLLVGRIQTIFSTKFSSQEIVSDCGKKTLDYKITLYRAGDAGYGNTFYHALIPKISADTKVRFNITILD